MKFETSIHEKVFRANHGSLPNAVVKLKSGWVVMSEVQPVFGYCLLFSDPVVRSLNSLSEPERIQYSLDAIRIGDALLKVSGCERINYETWGNVDPALHTHIVPRYRTEEEGPRRLPICKGYDFQVAPPFDLLKHSDFIARMKAELSGES